MKIFFLGASELGWHACQTLLDMGQRIVGIISVPQKFSISWSKDGVTNVRYKDFEDLAKQHQIPLSLMKTRMSDPSILSLIEKSKPDLILAIGWYHMVPKKIRDLAPMGAVGLHASLLPKYRGGAPLVWAVINGEKETGVSLFYLEEGVDEGDILGQRKISIDSHDEIKDVIQKSISASIELIKQEIPKLEKGTSKRIKQDHKKATLMAQRESKDGEIHWDHLSAIQVYNWIRAQSDPYPGAFTYINRKKIKFLKGELDKNESHSHLKPGSMVEDGSKPKGTFGVVCADHQYIWIVQVQEDGQPVMRAEDYMTKNKLIHGAQFG